MSRLVALRDSLLLLRLLLAVPGAILLVDFVTGPPRVGWLLNGSGEWAARLLVLSLAITPVRLIFRGQRWPMWFFRRRRDIGVASFLYASLHVAAYFYREGYVENVIANLAELRIWIGWIGFLAMLAAFLTSNDFALRRLGTAWKTIQRIAYVAALATFLHWLLIKVDNRQAFVWFVPLAALEAYRIAGNAWRASQRRAR